MMKGNNEIKIGIMVCVVIVLLGMLTFKTGKFKFSGKGYRIKVQFVNIDGVNLNSPVMINGYEIGIVEDIQINEQGGRTLMELTLWINDGLRLKENTRAYVKNLGFMGEKYVGLISPQESGESLKPGALIRGEDPANFDRLLADGQDIAGYLKTITKNIDERLEVNKGTVDEILDNMNLTLKNLASVVEKADARLKTNEDQIDGIVKNLHLLSVNLEEMSQDLKLNPWKIMYRTKEKQAVKD